MIEAVASSVGSAALQIAKSFDCWVGGTASQYGKLQHAKDAGADLIVNYKEEDLAAKVLAATSGEGANIGLMTIGEETVDSLVDSMGMDGKIVMYGSTGGRTVSFNLIIGSKNLQLLSMSISTSPAFVPGTMADFRKRALPRFADGTYKAIVSEVLPISELTRAHQMIDDRQHYGKVILELNT